MEQPDEHTGRRAKRKKAKEKSIDAEPRALDARGFRSRQRFHTDPSVRVRSPACPREKPF